MITEFMYLAIPAVITAFVIVFTRISPGAWVSSYDSFAGQSRLKGLLAIVTPAFAACMGVVCLVSGENIGLLMLGVKLSLLSMILLVVGSVISSALFVKNRNKD